MIFIQNEWIIQNERFLMRKDNNFSFVCRLNKNSQEIKFFSFSWMFLRFLLKMIIIIFLLLQCCFLFYLLFPFLIRRTKGSSNFWKISLDCDLCTSNCIFFLWFLWFNGTIHFFKYFLKMLLCYEMKRNEEKGFFCCLNIASQMYYQENQISKFLHVYSEYSRCIWNKCKYERKVFWYPENK